MNAPYRMIVALSLAGCISLPLAQAQSIVPQRIVVKHPSIAKNAPQEHSLIQALNERGDPVGYSMVVDSVLCTDGLCKVVNVTMTWDALGVYKSYTVEKGSILEKAVVSGKKASTKKKKKAWKEIVAGKGESQREQAWAAFTGADHARLHRILQDTSSVLRTQRMSDLTGYRDKSRVDGVTGATPATLKEAVVEGAALSSFHLWHWANGEVVAAARELTHASCSEELLRDYLDRDEPHYVLFALEHLRRHKLFEPSHVSAVIDVIRDGDQDRLDLGLAYLRSALPDKDAFHDTLATLFAQSNGKGRINLLGVLDAEAMVSGAHFDKMSQGLMDTKTYFELHLFLNLVEKHEHGSEQMLALASSLLDSENFFIARRAFQYLKKQSLDEQMTQRVQAFLEQSEKDGRFLQ